MAETKIPRFVELQKLLKKKLDSPNHVWGEGKLDMETLRQVPTMRRLWVPFWVQIDAVHVCEECGSTKRQKFLLRGKHWTGGWGNGYIVHSPEYPTSSCAKKYRGRRQPGPRAERLFTCEVCGKSFVGKRMRDRCQKRCLEKEWQKKQARRNLLIIRKLRKRGVVRKGLRKTRLDLAVYRLYRYCDWPVERISKKLKIRSDTVHRIIGRVFATLCISDKECVFSSILKEATKRKRPL